VVKAETGEKRLSGAKQAAEKGQARDELPKGMPQGLKPGASSAAFGVGVLP